MVVTLLVASDQKEGGTRPIAYNRIKRGARWKGKRQGGKKGYSVTVKHENGKKKHILEINRILHLRKPTN